MEVLDIDCYVVVISYGFLNSLNILYKDLVKFLFYEFVFRGNFILLKVKVNKRFFFNGFLFVYIVWREVKNF